MSLLAVVVPDGWVAVVGAGLVSWLAYMARQATLQAAMNERTAATLDRLDDAAKQLAIDHADLKAKFYGHVDAEKDRRIEELELRLAAASRFPTTPPD